MPQVVDYYLEQLVCPFKRLKNEPFKPVIDLEVSRFAHVPSLEVDDVLCMETKWSSLFFLSLRYDGELFLEEVDANYVLWEQQGRAGFEYSATMKEV